MLDAICKLSPKISIYITLKFYNDMTYDEMAKTLKIPVSTVKHRTKTAISHLKEILKGENENA